MISHTFLADIANGSIPSMRESEIERVRAIEAYSAANRVQVKIEIEHQLHAGMYVRTCKMMSDCLLTGALIKVPTILIVSGFCSMYMGGRFRHISGYEVFYTEANRKAIFISETETFLTMCFPTQAKTVKDAEEQFTNEVHLIQSREV